MVGELFKGAQEVAKQKMGTKFKDINIDKRIGSQEIKNNTDLKNINIEKRVGEKFDIEGGAYKDIKNIPNKTEINHVPAQGSYKDIQGFSLDVNDGPSIRMEIKDHRKTASWGSSTEAKEYRANQNELIKQGKFKEAMQMDIDDIKDKFGNKYDKAINEMKEYVNQLEKEGVI